jgi:hypothetical protein
MQLRYTILSFFSELDDMASAETVAPPHLSVNAGEPNGLPHHHPLSASDGDLNHRFESDYHHSAPIFTTQLPTDGLDGAPGAAPAHRNSISARIRTRSRLQAGSSPSGNGDFGGQYAEESSEDLAS